MKTCLTCTFWQKNTKFPWQNDGQCSELKSSDKMTIELRTGYDGGYVDYIETEPDFGCALHKPIINKFEIISLDFSFSKNIEEFVIKTIQHRWSVDEEYAKTEIKRYMTHFEDSKCFVGLLNGEPIATGVFDTCNEDVDKTLNPWNLLLWVEPEHRGYGYGKLLTQARFDYAKQIGYNTIYLDTIDMEVYHLKYGWETIKKIDNKIIMKYTL